MVAFNGIVDTEIKLQNEMITRMRMVGIQTNSTERGASEKHPNFIKSEEKRYDQERSLCTMMYDEPCSCRNIWFTRTREALQNGHDAGVEGNMDVTFEVRIVVCVLV